MRDEERKHSKEPVIEARQLTMAYGQRLVQRDLSFKVHKGEVKVIMGGSGCGKSTLLQHLIGMMAPVSGEIFFFGKPIPSDEVSLKNLRKRFGILYQSGALWSSLTLAENVALPLEEYTEFKKGEIAELVDFKLSLVGLSGLGHRYPSELSGGMKKRAGLARAMALDPEVLFFDEPSAGLDPLSSRRLDDLILSLREALQATIVVVTHELDSIFAIADSALFLDTGKKTATAEGDPRKLRDDANAPLAVRKFLRREADS
ncbi:MAG: ATP-binding cassette domain-containing protein [Opitutales bacterium]|nr:ATP-binding cassette domain-containing protein [Opitutales bacterium]MCH8540556.1 ATP-binding cassette domain-containing protein [Opitutales bacterium]